MKRKIYEIDKKKNYILYVKFFFFRNIYCRVPIWGALFTIDVSKPKPNRPNTMNLVEKWA